VPAVLRVCRHWYPAALRRLYRQIRINKISDYRRFQGLIRHDSKTLEQVRELVKGIAITKYVTPGPCLLDDRRPSDVCGCPSVSSYRATSALLGRDFPMLFPCLRRLAVMPDAKPVSTYILSEVVPQLDCLVQLSICGLDLRPDPWRRETSQRIGGTDELVVALSKATPRLTSLRIVGSPDLTEPALRTFLEAEAASAMTDLELWSCPGLGADSVRTIALACPQLRHLSIKALSLWDHASAADGDSPHPLAVVAQHLGSLVSICLSNLYCELPSDVFSGFRSAKQLTSVSLSSLCELNRQHLVCFTACTDLRIWDCPSLLSLPVSASSRLRSVSLFGSGLTVGSLWQLGKAGLVRLFLDMPVRHQRVERTPPLFLCSLLHVWLVSGLSWLFPSIWQARGIHPRRQTCHVC
jgi:hypothetical protein